MDREQARFILQSFRPNGSDVHSTDFTEALALAMENRELGEWLADERAFDATFAEALASVQLPENLRADIIGCLAGERGDFPQAENPLDCSLIGAFSSITPPPELRHEILTAMERTVRIEPKKKLIWHRFAVPLAAAAGVVFAFMVTRNDDKPALAEISRLPIEYVRTSFINTYESPGFALEQKHEDKDELLDNLKSRNLPCPCCLPHGLADFVGIGCRELIINGKRGSLICFRASKSGVVHLVVFRRSDVDGELPSKEQPLLVQNGRWATASWQHGENVFVLISTTDSKKLSELF